MNQVVITKIKTKKTWTCRMMTKMDKVMKTRTRMMVKPMMQKIKLKMMGKKMKQWKM